MTAIVGMMTLALNIVKMPLMIAIVGRTTQAHNVVKTLV